MVTNVDPNVIQKYYLVTTFLDQDDQGISIAWCSAEKPVYASV